MYGAILSVLLMGMLPVAGVPSLVEEAPLSALSVASPSPIEAQSSNTDLPKGLTASGLVIFDLSSGQQLYTHNAAERRPMGSLTKLMTALLIVENHSLDEQVTVPADIAKVEGTKAPLNPGSVFSVGDLLSAMLMASANDAAVTFARFHAGTEEAFVREMNARARSLGLRDTSFGNPAGLDDDAQWSSARDMGWLAFYVLRHPELRERMAQLSTVIHDTKGHALTINHTHTLLHTQSDVIAGKTGTTDAAGQCLLSLVEEDGREYVVVILGSRERYTDMKAVLRTLRSFSS